jgi:hypothetical protein
VSGIAIALSLGIPAKVFADATTSSPDTSAPQPSANQAPPTIQSTADAQASAPTASEPPTRDEIVAAAQPASQPQTEAGYSSLAEGAKVSFDVVPNRGKESAENLKLG